jgi:hypothetical protein
MPAGAFQKYSVLTQYISDGTLDLNTDAFSFALFASSSNALSALATAVKLADLTNQLATANGYTAGGKALTSITLTRSGAVTTFDAADVVWNATGGPISAHYGVVYKLGTANGVVNPLVCVAALNTGAADVIAQAGDPLTVTFPVTGILQLV